MDQKSYQRHTLNLSTKNGKDDIEFTNDLMTDTIVPNICKLQLDPANFQKLQTKLRSSIREKNNKIISDEKTRLKTTIQKVSSNLTALIDALEQNKSSVNQNFANIDSSIAAIKAIKAQQEEKEEKEEKDKEDIIVSIRYHDARRKILQNQNSLNEKIKEIKQEHKKAIQKFVNLNGSISIIPAMFSSKGNVFKSIEADSAELKKITDITYDTIDLYDNDNNKKITGYLLNTAISGRSTKPITTPTTPCILKSVNVKKKIYSVSYMDVKGNEKIADVSQTNLCEVTSGVTSGVKPAQ